MKIKNHILLFLFIFLIQGINLLAQNDSTKVANEKPWWKKGKQYVVVLNDGTEYIGEIVGDNEREVLISTKSMGKLYLPKFQIKSINLLNAENFSNGEFLNENPHPHNYMAATNALPFKKGEFRLNSSYFLAYTGLYSINSNVAAGVQTSLIGAPFGAVLKTSFPLGKTDYVGTETSIASLAYLGSNSSFKGSSSFLGNICVKYTRGDAKTNFTGMGGIGFVSLLQTKYIYTGTYPNQQTIREDNNSFYFNVSMFHRLTKNIGFAGEGWVVPKSEFGLLGLSIRILKNPEKSGCFGFYNLIYQSTNYTYNPNGPSIKQKNTQFFPIPYFGVSYKL